MATFTCIICPKGCLLQVEEKNHDLIVHGNQCPRGIEYGKKEFICPSRILTTTVGVRGGTLAVVPVKSAQPIALSHLIEGAQLLKNMTLQAPLKEGQVFTVKNGDMDFSFQITRDLPLAL